MNKKLNIKNGISFLISLYLLLSSSFPVFAQAGPEDPEYTPDTSTLMSYFSPTNVLFDDSMIERLEYEASTNEFYSEQRERNDLENKWEAIVMSAPGIYNEAIGTFGAYYASNKHNQFNNVYSWYNYPEERLSWGEQFSDGTGDGSTVLRSVSPTEYEVVYNNTGKAVYFYPARMGRADMFGAYYPKSSNHAFDTVADLLEVGPRPLGSRVDSAGGEAVIGMPPGTMLVMVKVEMSGDTKASDCFNINTRYGNLIYSHQDVFRHDLDPGFDKWRYSIVNYSQRQWNPMVNQATFMWNLNFGGTLVKTGHADMFSSVIADGLHPSNMYGYADYPAYYYEGGYGPALFYGCSFPGWAYFMMPYDGQEFDPSGWYFHADGVHMREERQYFEWAFPVE